MEHSPPDQGDSHDHENHDHGPHGHDRSNNANERRLLLSFILIFTFMIVEAVGGILSGSLALLADAGHMLTDAIALALAYAAFRFGRKAADSRRTFGYLRFEVLAGFINAVTLLGIAGWIIYEAWQRFSDPHEILAGPMLIVAIVGLLINLLVLWIMTRGDTEHVNIKGAILHVMGDLLGSVGAIAAAIIIYYTGWLPIDPILSVLVSLLILRATWRLLVKSTHILLEGAPEDVDPNEIVRQLKRAVPSVEDIRHVHVWSVTSGRTLATLQVRAKVGVDLPAMLKKVEHELLDKFGIEHPTIGIFWEDDARCSLEKVKALDPHAGHNH